MQHKGLWASYVVLLGGYALWSYTQVDPNLVLSNQPLLWQMQQLAWVIGYQNRMVSSFIYFGLITGLFAVYGFIIKEWSSNKLSRNWLLGLIIASCAVLFLSYPALSHDIFNYAMNAKMVILYGANPHVRVALDFPADPWILYLNNAHTPAPYAYGWTAISLIPGWLGHNHIQSTMIWFRILILISLGLLLKAQYHLNGHKAEIGFWMFALNPLVLIETVGNIHNDVVMMALVFWALVLAQKALKKPVWWIGAIILFGMSVSIKYATILVLGGTMVWWFINRSRKRVSFGGVQAITLFLPLLSSQSKRFLPWYLIWPLSFLPVTHEKIIQIGLIIFSFTSLLAYLPYLYLGGYSLNQQIIRQLILFLPPVIIFITYGVVQIIHKQVPHGKIKH